MKQLLIIIIALLMGYELAQAQGTGNVELFNANTLPKYSMYFSQAGLTEYGQLKLTAIAAYEQLKADEKKAMMSNIAGNWRDSVVMVTYGTKTELWGWSAASGNTWLLDEWDKAALQPAAPAGLKPQKMVMHPWFFYLGYQLMGDSQKTINFSFNSRIGFYLLMNRWDFAVTWSLGLSGNADSEADPTPYSTFGAMSRVHFPIKNTGFSPNVGFEYSWSAFGSTSSTASPSLVLGVSYFVGIGRIDVGFKIGNSTSGMGGYTMYPGMRVAK